MCVCVSSLASVWLRAGRRAGWWRTSNPPNPDLAAAGRGRSHDERFACDRTKDRHRQPPGPTPLPQTQTQNCGGSAGKKRAWRTLDRFGTNSKTGSSSSGVGYRMCGIGCELEAGDDVALAAACRAGTWVSCVFATPQSGTRN